MPFYYDLAIMLELVQNFIGLFVTFAPFAAVLYAKKFRARQILIIPRL